MSLLPPLVRRRRNVRADYNAIPTTVVIKPAANCVHALPCPPADAPDALTAAVVARYEDLDTVKLCNGLLVGEDTLRANLVVEDFHNPVAAKVIQNRRNDATHQRELHMHDLRLRHRWVLGAVYRRYHRLVEIPVACRRRKRVNTAGMTADLRALVTARAARRRQADNN